MPKFRNFSNLLERVHCGCIPSPMRCQGYCCHSMLPNDHSYLFVERVFHILFQVYVESKVITFRVASSLLLGVSYGACGNL